MFMSFIWDFETEKRAEGVADTIESIAGSVATRGSFPKQTRLGC